MRAESNRSSTNDTEVILEVKRDPGIDELEGDNQMEEEQDVIDEYNSGGVLEGDEEKLVLHAGRVRNVLVILEKHAHAVKDFVQMIKEREMTTS